MRIVTHLVDAVHSLPQSKKVFIASNFLLILRRLVILKAIGLSQQPRSRSWEDCGGMGLVRENRQGAGYGEAPSVPASGRQSRIRKARLSKAAGWGGAASMRMGSRAT
jgi:hypothetical protein